MVEFKKGDRVIINNPDDEIDCLQGMVGTVTKVHGDGDSTCEVKFDKSHDRLESRDADSRLYYDIYRREMSHFGSDYDLW